MAFNCFMLLTALVFKCLIAQVKLSTLLDKRINAFFIHWFSLHLPRITTCLVEKLKELTFILCFFSYSFPQTTLFLLILYSVSLVLLLCILYLADSTFKTHSIP